ncbi:MAG: VCBS domain-containing protein [Proteobacteria bacterium]|nr:VCBS domain-containing protein [Pseudomonadota bacterium]
MSTTTSSPIFSTTQNANNDIYTSTATGITEDSKASYTFNVMLNDLGTGNTLFSLDDGSSAVKYGGPADLLTQDTARTEAKSNDHSAGGASIWINSAGTVGYDTSTFTSAFKAQIQSLAAGQSLYDSFTYAIKLNNGTLSWATVYIEIKGLNDGPVVTNADLAGAVSEQGTPNGSITDTGIINFTDVDVTDTHFIRPIITASAGALGTLTASVTNDTTNGTGGEITWKYLVNAAAVEYLAKGQTKLESFTITLDDGNGGTVSKTINVTITGTNDAPVVTTSNLTGAITELGTPIGNLSSNGTIGFTDVDLTDKHTVKVISTEPTLGTLSATMTNDTVNGTGGLITWNYKVSPLLVEYLAKDQTKVESFVLRIDDGKGGVVDRTINVTITGTNDAPVITTFDATGAVTELGTPTGTLTDKGALLFADIDIADHHFIRPVTASPGALGSLSASITFDFYVGGIISWKYSVDPTAVEYLAKGQTKVESFTITLDDGNGGTANRIINVTITGTNDAPIVASTDVMGSVTEQPSSYLGNLTDNGTIGFTDVDLTDTHTISSITSSAGALGVLTASVSTDSTGGGNGVITWNYTVANSAIQYLTQGQTKVESFTIQLNDGNGGVVDRTIDVTISGIDEVTNHPPLAMNDSYGITDERYAPDLPALLLLNVLANDTDPDVGDTKSVTTASIGSITGYGFTPDDPAPLTWTAAAVSGNEIAKFIITAQDKFAQLNIEPNASAVLTILQDGSVTLNAGDAFDFLPLNQQLDIVLNYTMQDSASLSSQAQLTLTVTGLDNNDVILGSAISSGVGNDAIYGGNGDETFAMGLNLDSNDIIDGGPGYDTLSFTDNNTGNAELAFVTNIEKIVLGAAVTTVATLDSLVAPGQTLTVDGSGAVNMNWDARGELDGYFNITGSSGNDTFRFGNNFSNNNIINGGGGTDTLFINSLSSNNSLDNVSNVEVLTFNNASISETVVTKDSLVAAGQTLTVQGLFNSLFWNGAAETDGSFNIKGGFGVDTLIGGSQNDIFDMGTNLTTSDVINGGAGFDTLKFTDNTLGTNDLSGSIVNIEKIILGAAITNITPIDALVPAGATLEIDASATISLNWNAVQELDGYFNITGSAGNDTFTYGNNFSSNTTINAGDGTDTLTVNTLSANNSLDNVSNIEVLNFNSSSPIPINVITQDGLVAAGQTLTLNANASSLFWNGAAETDGSFNLTGGLGNDTLIGGAQDDTFNMNTPGALVSTDTINGGAGFDTLYFTDSIGLLLFNEFNGVTNIEKVILGAAVTTLATQDSLIAAGQTLLVDGSATTSLNWNSSLETDGKLNITGSSGTDILVGGSQDDTFIMGSNLNSSDSINGGAGFDTLTFIDNNTGTNELAAVTNIENILLGAAVTNIVTSNSLVSSGQTLTVDASNAVSLNWNALQETDGFFNITGSAGNDIFTFGNSFSNNNAINAGDGTDTLIVNTLLSNNSLDNISDIEILTLNTANLFNVITQDNLVATGQTLTVNGKATGLIWNGAAETDGSFNVTGTTGIDTITGGAQDDTFNMGSNLTNADVINGGAGTNTLYFTDNGTGADELSNVTNIQNIVLGAAVTNINATLDSIVPLGQTLTVDGSTTLSLNWSSISLNRSVNVTGSASADTITGGTQNDILSGGSGNDIINGSSGNDTINGGLGVDTLSGGLGTDTFVFNIGDSVGTVGGSGNSGTVTGFDLITDFNFSDIIDLPGAAVRVAAVTLADGINSSLTIGGNQVGKHSVSSGGVASFFTQADVALTLTSLSDVAAALQYLQSNNLGAAASTIAFNATISGINHSYIYEQVGLSPNAANDIFIDVQNSTFTSFPVGPTLPIRPAGISGEPINLALNDPTTGKSDIITLTILNAPIDWSFNQGIKNNDGSWTIQTNFPELLTVTTSTAFVGAKVLDVNMNWSDENGVSHHSAYADNIEAYAPGSAIFALSVDDTLTGTQQADQFVLQEPISHVTLVNFDTALDKINLIGFDGVNQFSDLHVSNDGYGDAVINIGINQSIVIRDVNASSLTASQFVFNETPHTLNNGEIAIDNGAIMPFGGILENNGVLDIAGTMLVNGNITGNGLINMSNQGVLKANDISEQVFHFENNSMTTITLAHGSNNTYEISLQNSGVNVISHFDPNSGDSLSVYDVKDANHDGQVNVADLDASAAFINIHDTSGSIIGVAAIFNQIGSNLASELQSAIDSFTQTNSDTGTLQNVAHYIATSLSADVAAAHSMNDSLNLSAIIVEGHSTADMGSFAQLDTSHAVDVNQPTPPVHVA